MITENRKRIKRILEWLKAELESHYKFEKSSLTPLTEGLGSDGYLIAFDSQEIAIDIWYWNSGI